MQNERQYAGMTDTGSYYMEAERNGVPLTILYDTGHLIYKADRDYLKITLEMQPNLRQSAINHIRWEMIANSDAENYVGTIHQAESQIEYDLNLPAYSLFETDQWKQREPGDRPARPIERRTQ